MQYYKEAYLPELSFPACTLCLCGSSHMCPPTLAMTFRDCDRLFHSTLRMKTLRTGRPRGGTWMRCIDTVCRTKSGFTEGHRTQPACEPAGKFHLLPGTQVWWAL